MKKPVVDILLGTYNGEAYIEEQLNSIQAQTGGQDFNWRVLIHDDGSTDGTLSIVKKFRKLAPKKFHLLQDGVTFSSPAQNFIHLLQKSSAPYIMFCDQDDIWKPEKVSASLEALQQMESKYGDTTPLLVHTDLILIDAQGDIIAPSMWQSQRMPVQIAEDPCKISVQNVVTGNTICMNKAAKEISLHMPQGFPVHDWWVAIQVAKRGHIEALPRKTIYYRQHSNNVIGAKSVKGSFWLYFLKRLGNLFETLSTMRSTGKLLADDPELGCKGKRLLNKIKITWMRLRM